jgi:hypothetical protein
MTLASNTPRSNRQDTRKSRKLKVCQNELEDWVIGLNTPRGLNVLGLFESRARALKLVPLYARTIKEELRKC